jgi:tryptophan-rich sensory protein
MILNARGAPGRGLAIAAFIVQLIANYCWSPLFFGMHQISAAFWLILFILAAAIVTTLLFGRIRSAAAWLMVPYMMWLSFASILNYQFDQLNPDAETLVPPAASANITFGQGE